MLSHDRGIHIVNRILVVSSMCLSGYFGWVLGEGVVPLNVVLAAMCASVAYGVSLMFERAAAYNAHGLRASATICWGIGALFLAANTLFDYSSAAAVREAVATHATNANNKAHDVRGQIELLRKNISDAKGTTAWQAALQPPEAYEAEIKNLEGNATIMKRSKECSDQTLADTKSHCERLGSAKANLAMAMQRRAYEGQVAKWESELGKLTAKAEVTEFATNPAIAQVRAVASWAVLSRELTEANVFWGQNAIMLLMTILVNAGLAFLGNEIGTMRATAGAMPHMQPDYAMEPRRLAYVPEGYPTTPPPIPPQHAEPPRALTPAPPAPASSHSETIIVQGGSAFDPVKDGDPNLDEILKRSQEAADKARRMLDQMKAMGTA